ncbi:MliC family protein [Ponticoccus alexandrii]|uniref:Lysozyme inhibitor n=1 Tax=Ponticoccus alexandrii TaxID=1943633 RepID=A0ABX7FFN4_9RHOB|nr:MliC family protein [Ponticoccus alexandrii]QRF69017.1 lysozyme inhibitor [Ponticoccus alexandrii]
MRFGSFVAISAVCATAASAEVSFSLDFGSRDMMLRTQGYACGEAHPFSVHYLTSATDVLALVPVDGGQRVFVNVVAASGARYVSGHYEWWTKGGTATLSDVRKGEALLQCTASDP